MQQAGHNQPANKKRIGSYPAFGVVLNITIALCITGLLGLILIYTNGVNEKIKENIEVKIYLHKDISQNDRLGVQKKLMEAEFVAQIDGKPQVRYLSREDAMKLVSAKTGEEFTKIIGENPLPDSYYIRMKEEFYEPNKMELVRAELESIDGIGQIIFEEASIEEINKNFRTLTYIFVTFALIFFAASVLLIDNSIRLALFSQRFLIRSMQLVGAEPMFIKRPFLVRSAIQGLIGGVIASVGVWVLSDMLVLWIDELSLIQDRGSLVLLSLFLIVFGVATVTGCTFFAVSKYLKMSLDELY